MVHILMQRETRLLHEGANSVNGLYLTITFLLAAFDLSPEIGPAGLRKKITMRVVHDRLVIRGQEQVADLWIHEFTGSPRGISQLRH